MTLRQVAQHLSELSESGSTPVLVSPSDASLQSDFFLALASELLLQRDQSAPLRIDVLSSEFGAVGIIKHRLDQRLVKQINRSQGSAITAEFTSTLTRPEPTRSPQAPLVIGYCRATDAPRLPAWAHAVEITAAA